MLNSLTNKFYLKLLYIFIGLSFATVISDFSYFSLLNKGVLALALLFLVITFFERLSFRIRKVYSFEYFLYLFLALTLYLNFTQYKINDNLKIWLVNLIIMTVLFSIDTYKSKIELIKELKIISYFYSSMTFILSFASLVIIFLNKNINHVILDKMPSLLDSSYTGLFKNENSFGIAAGLSFMITLYLIFDSNKFSLKSLLSINLFVQFISIFISNGRSAIFPILTLILIFLFYKFKNIYIRVSIIGIPALASIVAFFTLPTDILHKILTGREFLWQSAFKLFEKYPLTGVGNVNKVGRLQDVRVTYLQGLESGGLHNIFFEILTVNGLIAVILFILFLVFLFIFLFKKVSKISNHNKVTYIILISLLLSIVFINFLESSLVYIISFISIIFWVYAGYLVAILDKR